VLLLQRLSKSFVGSMLAPKQVCGACWSLGTVSAPALLVLACAQLLALSTWVLLLMRRCTKIMDDQYTRRGVYWSFIHASQHTKTCMLIAAVKFCSLELQSV
jgi:hypothetical protein